MLMLFIQTFVFFSFFFMLMLEHFLCLCFSEVRLNSISLCSIIDDVGSELVLSKYLIAYFFLNKLVIKHNSKL